MTEYIEREAAISSLDELENTSYHNSVLWPDHVEECREALRSIPAADVRPVVQRDAVMQALSKYFSIGDSDTYELTRVKEAFYVGTMTLEDFEEWNEDNVSDLCDYLMKELFCPNCGADMR